jgi:hypothetical protein
VAVRTLAVSPFPADADGMIYAGGFDCDDVPNHDSAWALRAPLSTALTAQ